MDRARRTTANRRRPQGSSASPPSNSDASFDHQPSASPVMAHATNNNTPQTAPQGRRASKPLQHSFTFSTPGPNRPLNLRKRSKTMDDYNMAEDDYENNESPKKGGHSLRKRARVDYTFEQIDDEVEVPSSTAASASRNKRRKPDNIYDTEDFYGSGLKRRGASVDADTPSSRRRNPTRKSSELRAYKEEIENEHDEDENDVQDTIEVGVSFSDSGEPDVTHTDLSNTSSTDLSTEAPQKSTPTQSQLDGVQTHCTTDDLNEAAAEKRPDSGSDSLISKILVPVVSESTVELAQDPNLHNDSSEPQLKIQEGASLSHGPHRSSSEPPQSITQLLPEQQGHKREHSSMSATMTDNPSLTARGDEEDAPTDVFVENPFLQQEPESLGGGDEGRQSPEQQSMLSHTRPLATDAVAFNDLQTQDDASQDGDMVASNVEPSTTNGMMEPSSPLAQENTLPASSQVTNAETKSTEPVSVAEDEVVSSPTVQTLDTVIRPIGQTLSAPFQTIPPRPQPRPVGRWAHLTPYLDGEYVSYPEKKSQEDEAGVSEDQTPEYKDMDRDVNDIEPMVDDNDDIPDVGGAEAPTPALNTPTRGSPVPYSTYPTAANSPVAGGDDADEVDVSESQEPPERRRYFRYRKLRDAQEYISTIENFENMSTADLYELIDAINVSLVQWQTEWNGLGKVVDDYENSLRRRVADVKYESRTRNFHQHGTNYEEPDFVVKGYKAKDKETMNETRYLQAQDRIMAAAYGFEYDPHPSKIGRQNPETQQVGIMTRGRSLRNQPKPTAKATETDEVTGKRQRKPVQLFDPATQDVSRSSTPVPTRGRRRKNANAENEDNQPPTSSFNSEPPSDGEGEVSKMRRKRGPRPRMAVPSIVEEFAPAPGPVDELSVRETPSRSGRRRIKQPIKYDDEPFPFPFAEEEAQEESKPKRRHLLTLKIPKASSDSTSHTAESSYSFRPKRQKRFRDDPDEAEDVDQLPSKKRAKRGNQPAAEEEEEATPTELVAPQEALQTVNRKVQKIKVVRVTPASRKGTPASLPNGEEGDEPQKDYKSMTKSEKMSASMKSRWANGNMAGAVEKRKATLAAKKAAQAAAEQQRVGLIAPKPKAKSSKKDALEQAQPDAFTQTTLPGMGFPFPAS